MIVRKEVAFTSASTSSTFENFSGYTVPAGQMLYITDWGVSVTPADSSTNARCDLAMDSTATLLAPQSAEAPITATGARAPIQVPGGHVPGIAYNNVPTTSTITAWFTGYVE